VSFQIGQTVQLNGKEYKIVGTKARSYLLERDGKTYKATADKLTKIQAQNSQQPQAPQSALIQRLAFKRIFNKAAQLPVTEAEFAQWFDDLRCELSPENLASDGEATRTQISQKLRTIKACWKELEMLCGKRVAE